jgi:Lipocalin-like domain
MSTVSFKTDIISKAFLLTACLAGFAGVMRCDAQSIVGKWKQISGKMYCTADAVKNSHGHLQEVMDMPKVDVVDEFKSDHTLTETITTGSTKTSNSGTWTMAGKTVTISVTGHPPMSGIVSDTDNTLIYTVEMPKSDHMQVIKRQWTYSKV